MYVVEAPDVAPARGGLLSVARLAETTDGGFAVQGVDYQAGLCGPVRRIPANGAKEFERVPVVTGEPFGVYRGVESSLFERGASPERARAAFEAGESHGVEQALQALVLNERADVLTEGGEAVSPKVGLGMLEQHAGETYGGLPLIHVNRFGATFLPVEVDSDTWVLHTRQGTPIANGSGYGPTGPGGEAAEQGTFWMYATGTVSLFRGPLLPVSADDPRSNTHRSLVERMYVPTVECFVAAVLVRGE